MKKALRSFILLLIKVFARLEVIGLENIPLHGAYIIAANHLSRLDAVLIPALVDRDDLTGFITDKYMQNPAIRWLVNAYQAIWINREEADFRALRQAIDYLNRGGALGIAPEGTRSATRALIPAKTGVAYLAEKARAPVIPVAIQGTETAITRLLRGRRPTIRIQFGRPFTLPPLEKNARSAALERNTVEIMCRIAAMLPQAYWGAYAGHPRLKELLAEPGGLVPTIEVVAGLEKQ